MAAWASVRLISGGTVCLRTVGTIHSGRVGIGTPASHIKKPVEIVPGDRRRSLQPANYKGALSAAAAGPSCRPLSAPMPLERSRAEGLKARHEIAALLALCCS